jgi:putative transcription factor
MVEECELCGRQTKDIYVLNVENVELRTCASCAKGKKVVRTELERQVKKPDIRSQRTRPKTDEEKELVEDYPNVVRRARERMKIPIKVLAEMLNEKEHLILRVEEGKTLPSIPLTKKLEKALKIKLTEEGTEEVKSYTAKKATEPTIGDFVEG